MLCALNKLALVAGKQMSRQAWCAIYGMVMNGDARGNRVQFARALVGVGTTTVDLEVWVGGAATED